MEETINRGLSAARRKLSQLAQPEAYRIDLDQIGRGLDLENEAKKLAAAGLPAPGQTTLSAPEAKAVQAVEQARKDLIDSASARVLAIGEELSGNDARPLIEEALSADRTFEHRAAAAVAEHEHLLAELAEHAAVRERELEDFRAEHHLTRPATYPEGSATFARYAILLSLIVVEGAANAYFFSQGLDSGLIGGFLAAGLFAAVNLVTAFVLGKHAIRYVFHRNVALKALGAAAIAAAVVAMMTVGLTIAHFRDALTGEAAEPARAAWAALQASPFGLRDLMSWLLFAISVLFAVFALFDGFSSDDRYPGYGAVARRARQAREDYLAELQAVRDSIEAVKEDAQETIARALQRARAIVAESTQRIREKRWIRAQIETALLDSEHWLEAALKAFRDTNRMHRGARAVPPYFDTLPALKVPALPEFGSDDERAWLEKQEQYVETLASRADHLRETIAASFHAHTDRLKPADRRLGTATVRPLTLVRDAERSSHATK